MMITIHASLHPRPAQLPPAGEVAIHGRRVVHWAFDAAAAQNSWEVTFDGALEQLEKVPRLYAEPDGSWLLVSAVGESPRWQMEGNLYDGGSRLAYCDLKGSCPVTTWEQLLACFGWPHQPLLLQLTHAAVFVDEADYRGVVAGT